MKRIVVASDSFKGSLSSAEVAGSVEKGIHAVFPDCEVVRLSVADGGEGTVGALIDTLGGTVVEKTVSNPIMKPVTASYGLLDDGSAVIEMSAASGLPLLRESERNPMLTSTYGTGELIMDAIGRGCRKFLVGIGGSATNDAGTGMLAAMGFRFLDADGCDVVPCGGSLGYIVSIDRSGVAPEVLESEFVVACDVDTPFCGPAGAAYVFAPQKGADADMVKTLDDGMAAFASVVARELGIVVNDVPGTGAAGGLGGGFLAFLRARLVRGVDMVLDAIDFDSYLEGADLVITGEGKIDFQTSKGKTPHGVMMRASRRGIPVIGIGGCVDRDNVGRMDGGPGFASVFPVVSGPVPLDEAMRREVAAANVTATVMRIMNLIKNLKCDE